MPTDQLTRLLDLGGYRVLGIAEESATEVIIAIEAMNDTPICSGCGQGCLFVHSTEEREVRHLDAFQRRCRLRFDVRYVRCERCGLRVELNPLVAPRKRSTRAFRRYVGRLCKMLPISDVAEHVGMAEDTVRAIDKEFLAEHYPPPDFGRLKRLAVDEIAYRKGHNYLTVVLDYDSGEVVWTGEGRGEETLSAFFKLIGPRVCRQIVAVSLDMAAPYAKAISMHCPKARHVFDRFHVAKHLNEAVNDTRKLVLARAGKRQRELLKGKRFVLLRRYDKLSEEQAAGLDELLELNVDIAMAYVLKEQFDLFWSCGNAGGAARFLNRWARDAKATEIPPVVKGDLKRGGMADCRPVFLQRDPALLYFAQSDLLPGQRVDGEYQQGCSE